MLFMYKRGSGSNCDGGKLIKTALLYVNKPDEILFKHEASFKVHSVLADALGTFYPYEFFNIYAEPIYWITPLHGYSLFVD